MYLPKYHIRSLHQPKGRKAGTAGTYLTLCGRMRWWMETIPRPGEREVTCEECILLDFARKAEAS